MKNKFDQDSHVEVHLDKPQNIHTTAVRSVCPVFCIPGCRVRTVCAALLSFAMLSLAALCAVVE